MKVACSASLSIAGIASALMVVAGPCPARYLAELVQLVVAVGVRVLHRHPGAELDVLAHGLAKLRLGGHLGCVPARQVELDAPLALLPDDTQAAVNREEGPEAGLA